MGEIDAPVLPIHVEDNRFGPRYASQNAVYCRRCRHRFGGAYGAIAAGFCDWCFCPYCGVRIVQTNPYHQPPEETWRGSDDWNASLPPDRWQPDIEGQGRELNVRQLPAET